jgi:hypothetical protein
MDRSLHQITAIRRLRVYLLLPLLLLLSQHGAWLHELSHLAYAAHPHQVTARLSDASFENGVCPSCQSFGQLGSALASTPGAVPSPLAQLRPLTEPPYSQPLAQPPAPRNRGPPRLA